MCTICDVSDFQGLLTKISGFFRLASHAPMEAKPSHVSFFPITPCKLSSIMATFSILSLCIVTTLFTPFFTCAANYKDGDKVDKSSKFFVLYSNDNSNQSAHLQVPLYVNKVGPYFNPQETYHYYSLPVCRPEKVNIFAHDL